MVGGLLVNAPRKSLRPFVQLNMQFGWGGEMEKKENILFFRLYNCNLSLLFCCKIGKASENDIVSEVSSFLMAQCKCVLCFIYLETGLHASQNWTCSCQHPEMSDPPGPPSKVLGLPLHPTCTALGPRPGFRVGAMQACPVSTELLPQPPIISEWDRNYFSKSFKPLNNEDGFQDKVLIIYYNMQQ